MEGTLVVVIADIHTVLDSLSIVYNLRDANQRDHRSFWSKFINGEDIHAPLTYPSVWSVIH